MHTKEAGRHFVQQPPTQCGGVARSALVCSVCIGKYMCGPVVVCVCKGIMAHNDCNVKLSQLFLWSAKQQKQQDVQQQQRQQKIW